MKIVDTIIKKFIEKFLSPRISWDESKKNYSLYFGGKHVHVEGQTTKHTPNEVIEFLKENKKILQQEKVLDVIREDQKQEFDDLTSGFKEHRKLLKEIKPYLDDEDKHALELSFVYKKRVERNDLKLANETKEKIRNLYGERGNRIRLLFEGGYFLGMFYEKLQITKIELGELEAKRQFRDYIDRILHFLLRLFFQSSI